MTDVRANIAGWGKLFVANKSWFEYDETRPMPLNLTRPIKNDCSGTVTLAYYLAGAPDPNGLGYSGEGYTGTLITHGQPISEAEVLPADLVIYGDDPGVHTALVVEAGADPLTVSHGSPAEPAFVRISSGNPTSIPPRFFRYDTTLTFPDHVPHPPSKPTPETYMINVTWPVLNWNDNSNYVRKLQGLLSANGFATQISGRYDAGTRESVLKFQALHNLTEHITVGAETLSALLRG